MKTLVVSLQGLALQNLQQVVTARGIERVLVVDLPSAFSGAGGIAAVGNAANLRSAPAGVMGSLPPTLTFAFADGATSAKLSPSAYGTLAQAGFSFVNDAALSSFTSTVVLDAASLATTSPTDANYGTAVSTVLTEGPSALAGSALYNGNGQAGLSLSVSPAVS
ncbi:MAG: hypothetical protein EBR33_10035, partial [Synechococcaceae bacterium WB4_1_0192]|nr:hypothetical protein [Synechococcaceae bacterium WB4_1_0192]